MTRNNCTLAVIIAVGISAAAFAGVGLADSTPIGSLPSGPASTIETQKGQLIAVALPHRQNGRVWRVARSVDASVLHQVAESDIGSNVVLIFKATGSGTATVAFGLTRGETPKAYESRRYTVRVR